MPWPSKRKCISSPDQSLTVGKWYAIWWINHRSHTLQVNPNNFDLGREYSTDHFDLEPPPKRYKAGK